MQSYRLIGKTTRNQVADQILQAVMKWQESWCIDIKQPSVDVETTPCTPKSTFGFSAKGNDDISLFCFENEADWKKILFGHKSTSCPHDSITTATINDAKNAFVKSMHDSLKIKTEQNLTFSEFPLTPRANDGHVFVNVQIQDQVLIVWLAPQVVAQFVPASPKPAKPALTKRAEACQASTTTVTATLKLGSFPITLLQSLAVGDVLSTDVKLGTPLQLDINEKTSLPVHLGQQDDHKALLFLSNT